MSKREIDAVGRLKAVVRQAGNQQAAAKVLGCSPVHIGDLLRGRRTFSDGMLAKLGLRRSVVNAR